MKKLITAAFASFAVAGPSLAAPLRVPTAPILPAPRAVAPAQQLVCQDAFSNLLAPYGAAPCRQPNAAELAQRAEFQRTMYIHGLKEKADKVCRVTENIKLFNPYGGMWASKGALINAVAAKPSDDWNGVKLAMDASEYDHLVKDCGLGRMAQFAGNSAENQSAFAAAYSGGITPDADTGGPVFVRSHTRCNDSKCWPVRSYTRSR